MKKPHTLFILLLIIFAGVLFWANRANLTSKFDAIYWKDRFDHSQWQLPLSQRTLGDNGLYAFEGNRLIHGGDPAQSNAENPPLGKYAIGAAIQLFGNGSWYGVITSLLICILFFILSKRVLHSSLFALAVTTILACDPLLVSQWPATMLDNLHLVFLLLFFILLESYTKQKQRLSSVILSGIALGAFSAIKFPVFSPIVAAAGCYYLWHIKKNIRDVALLLGTAAATYIVTYTQYFRTGHTIIDWFHVQTWMIHFYYHSPLQANIGSMWTILLANRYQNLFTKLWQPVAEWSISWPIITVLTGYLMFRFLKRNPRKTTPLILTISASIILIMAVYTFIAFWTRYLLLILPFLYLGAAAALQTFKKKRIFIVFAAGLICFNVYTSWHIIFPTPEADVQQFVYDWKNGFFQDMYERFTIHKKTTTDRYTFLRDMQQITRDGEIETTDITILPTSWKQFVSPQYISFTVTYHTRNLGDFTQTIHLPIVNENGLWRIPWQPQYFIQNLTREDSLQTTVVPAKRGTITDHIGHILAEDVPGSMIWVTPECVDTTKEQAMLKYLETIFGGLPRFSAVDFYHRYSVNSQPDWPVAIGVLPMTQTVRSTLLQYPGISLSPAFARSEASTSGLMNNTHFTECCSLLYTTTTYDGMSGWEQTYNDRLKGINGGTLVIMDKKGTIIQTLIRQEKKDGEDVLL